MALSWNEIKTRAVEFSKEWENEKNERAESQTFWNQFFNVFGIERRRVSTFEEAVKKLNGATGHIDLFWPGVLLGEHKSKGEDLEKAKQQAIDYTFGLSEKLLPKYILLSDFDRFIIFDLEEKTKKEFQLKDLQKHVQLFGFIAGYQKQEIRKQDPANIKAAELMAELHDEIAAIGYTGHELEVFLVRVLFCLFAEDTGIFEKQSFWNYAEWKSKEDGSDLGMHLAAFFQVLNTPKEKRQTTLDEELSKFDYVNGGLFAETLSVVSFNSAMRKALLKACDFDWAQISPAIFGSMFQGVMDKKERRALGAHYTSEANILKLIKPLFLDQLWEEFKSCGNSTLKLNNFHTKLGSLKFLDPACGCGNFLVIAYRELRLLELEFLKKRYGTGLLPIDVKGLIKVKMNNFFGIEISEFPARIAQTSMWLVDHQMNELVAQAFGKYVPTLPLVDGVNIKIGNALTTDWETLVPKSELSYILGNPPFIGSKLMDVNQREEIETVFGGSKGAGVLDYVTGWYAKAAQYIKDTQIKCAFVSTNSITQGEQVGILWKTLLDKYNIKIHFAHRTFKWSNEASGKAAVFCVIIGFANFDADKKLLYEYENIKGEPHEIVVKNINPYLLPAEDIIIESKQKPICDVPEIGIGNKPIDDGNYLFTSQEKKDFLIVEPTSSGYFKRWLGSEEFINSIERWCLWLGGLSPEKLRGMPEVLKRIEAVKNFRLASTSPSTRKLAEKPTRFHVENMPEGNFLVIPETSSENRKYIPMGFLSANDFLVSNAMKIMPNATLYHFGILESEMHMAWVRQVCGRLKSDFRYSKDIVYNNFPWPENISDDKTKAIEQAAQNVLDVRKKYMDSGSLRRQGYGGQAEAGMTQGASLADLYDPLTMPADLVKAHQNLDKAVDSAYTRKTFTSDAERLEFLFELYKKYAA